MTQNMNGFLNVLKPPGMTSSDAVLFVRKRLPRGTKVGHGGTLDPEAAGVLPICVGKAARLFDYIIDKEKEYIAELMLGIETDTQDATGAVIAQRPVTAGENEIRLVLPELIGEIEQVPPMYSAIKRDGKRLYELARMGDAIELEPRKVQVYGMDYLCPSGENRHMIRVRCGKGVYVRTLMYDIGRMLHCGAHMSFLLRSAAGIFAVDEAVTLDAIGDAEDISEMLYPLDAPLKHLPAVYLPDKHLAAIGNGNPVRRQWYDDAVPAAVPVRVYCAGVFAGIGSADEEGLIRFKAMLM